MNKNFHNHRTLILNATYQPLSIASAKRSVALMLSNKINVIKTSKGGQHEWQNVVACCKKCNLIKADKYLNQTILKLVQAPLKPEGNFWIKTIIGSNPDPEWKEFLISA